MLCRLSSHNRKGRPFFSLSLLIMSRIFFSRCVTSAWGPESLLELVSLSLLSKIATVQSTLKITDTIFNKAFSNMFTFYTHCINVFYTHPSSLPDLAGVHTYSLSSTAELIINSSKKVAPLTNFRKFRVQEDNERKGPYCWTRHVFPRNQDHYFEGCTPTYPQVLEAETITDSWLELTKKAGSCCTPAIRLIKMIIWRQSLAVGFPKRLGYRRFVLVTPPT